METLNAKTKSVGGLLSQDFFFHIPEYQRPFSWETDNFEDLADDIIGADKNRDYFLGTIVLHLTKEPNQYDVVDGQQRLTSLMVLIACLRDLVAKEDFKNGLQEKILQKKNVVDGIPEKLRLEVKDREIFNKVVAVRNGTESTFSSNLPEPEWRYVKAVEVFRAKFGKLNQNELEEKIEFISQKCMMIYLSTTDFDDAFRLFTVVNDRGKQLRRLDVLKALNISPDVITKDTVRTRVAQQWEMYEKNLGEAAFENTFHLLRLAVLQDKPQGDLLKEFEERIFAAGKIVKGEPFFDRAFDYAEKYASTFINKDVLPESSPEYKKYVNLINIMDQEFQASEWRACILHFLSTFGSSHLYPFILAIEKVYLAQWVKSVRKDERYGEYAKILGLITTEKKPDDVISKMTMDLDSIKNATQQTAIYGASYCKYFLLRLELSVSDNDAVHLFSAKSIEHVLPQNPESTGYWATKHNVAEIGEYVHSIGNLVLLSKGKNSAAQNYDFEKKKEKYLKPRVTDYPRSVQVLSVSDWTKEVIVSRTIEAKDLIIRNL